ncbi:acyl-CoA dehydrogenase IpdE2 [Mycobacterium palustre]|uniref:Acyl-CoA dehydrogenase n=1 Tax=Mycobacterium palustre TaxID=153971 RepID=A0A1X1ZM87_9MYCO|nr:acyl-CoA dehydrogenase family protein [Mycobacterium palustre]ORW24388.1 acyl-CoA dehydrogenase [Mycobacterium palustre]
MTEERDLLRETVRGLVTKHAGPKAVRDAIASERGYDESLWKLLCEQVGVAALLVPEEFGGAGGDLADAATVLAELARGLVPSPLLGTTLAELALSASDDPDADTLARLAEGTAIGAVVFDADAGRREEQRAVDYVVNGDVADVVVAVGDGRLTRWTTFLSEPLATMDPTRRLGRVTPRSTTPLGTDPGIADIAAILVAAEQIGAAGRCLELTVEYTKQRFQFGRPIGSFQALKHRMADLFVKLAAARAVVDDALAEPSPTAAALARFIATEAFSATAAEAVQMHGGIAITWEHDIQLYFKRAHSSAQLLGPARHHLRRLEREVLGN